MNLFIIEENADRLADMRERVKRPQISKKKRDIGGKRIMRKSEIE